MENTTLAHALSAGKIVITARRLSIHCQMALKPRFEFGGGIQDRVVMKHPDGIR